MVFIQTILSTFDKGTPVYQKILEIFKDCITVSASGVVVINNTYASNSLNNSSAAGATAPVGMLNDKSGNAAAAIVEKTKQTKEPKYRR